VRKIVFLFVLFLTSSLLAATADSAAPGAWKPLEDFWGGAGWQEDGFWVLGFPRSDLNVMVEGTPLETTLGLTSYLRFRSLSKGLEVKGQLVLLDQESRRVEDKLILDGFKLEDFGDLLVGETPAIKRLDFSGKGTVGVLDAELKEILGLTGTPLTPLSFPTPAPGAAADWDPVQTALGQKGFIQGKVLWLLDRPFTPASEPAPGFLSLRIQRDGSALLVLGEAILDSSKTSELLKTLARAKMTVTSLRPSAEGAIRLRWWGSGEEAQVISVIQKISSLNDPLGEARSSVASAEPPSMTTRKPATTPTPATEGF
jgi:hypothetical protein